jgi:N-acetylmuramoyl-L-alanine amidase
MIGNIFAYTVLIDPGHGGEDQGARARYYFSRKKWKQIEEKDVALQLAKRIHYHISKKHTAFLTRSMDRSVSLQERAQLAEKISADLFISVHVNSSPAKNPRGFETYYLDNHEDAAVNKVEHIENKNLEGEELVINKILTDLVIDQTVKHSTALARSVHNEIYKLVGRRYRLKDRGIKPGLFFVLALAKRPAILLEVGFLSNSKELKKLLSKKFQERYAKAVAKGVDRYFRSQTTTLPSLF